MILLMKLEVLEVAAAVFSRGPEVFYERGLEMAAAIGDGPTDDASAF